MKTLLITLTILSTGLMAGLFFTWTNAVSPGIGKLNDQSYLSALQSMNRVILNPLFYLVFFMPIITLPVSTALNYGPRERYDFRLLLLATVIYWCGTFLVTLFGNIPLNELLNQTALEHLTMAERRVLRQKIEGTWNHFNLIRTLSSLISFSLLIIGLILSK